MRALLQRRNDSRPRIAPGGGNVEARSKGVGLGTEFIVRLPVSLSVCASSDVTSASAATRGKNASFIEDNVDAADSLAVTFQMMGHDAHVAYDGASGLKDFEEAAAWSP